MSNKLLEGQNILKSRSSGLLNMSQRMLPRLREAEQRGMEVSNLQDGIRE